MAKNVGVAFPRICFASAGTSEKSKKRGQTAGKIRSVETVSERAECHSSESETDFANSLPNPLEMPDSEEQMGRFEEWSF